MLNSRIQCENAYSNSLYEIGNKKMILNEGSLGKAIETFKIDCLNKSHHSSQFVENLKSEILDPLKQMMREHDNSNKKYFDYISNLDKDLSNLKDRLFKNKQRFDRAVQEADECLFQCEDSMLKSNEIYHKINHKLGSLLQSIIVNERSYALNINYANQNLNTYYSSINEIIGVIHKQEEQRIQTIKDCLHKLIIFETSEYQNNKYDVQSICNAIEAINIQKDIDLLISNLNKKEKLSFKFEFPISGWAKLHKLYEENYFSSRINVDYIQLVEETKKKILIEDDKEYHCIRLRISEILSSIIEKENYTHDNILEINNVILTQKGKVAFNENFQKYVSQKNLFLKPGSYKNLALIIMAYLDSALENKEFNLVMELHSYLKSMILENSDQQTLFFAVSTHNIWKSKVYWTKIVQDHLYNEIRILRNLLIIENNKIEFFSQKFNKKGKK